MKLKNFFLNCLNRRSFQFLNFVGFFLFAILATYRWMICVNEYIANEFAGGYLTVVYTFFILILPTFGLVILLSIIAIYIKLLYKEFKNPEYRIKNKFLTQNPIFGIFAFLFYIFAVICILGLFCMGIAAFKLNSNMFLHELSYMFSCLFFILSNPLVIIKICFTKLIL